MIKKPISKAVSESRQRTTAIRFLERELKHAAPQSATDAILRKALDFLRGAAKRNNAKPGGLGK